MFFGSIIYPSNCSMTLIVSSFFCWNITRLATVPNIVKGLSSIVYLTVMELSVLLSSSPLREGSPFAFLFLLFFFNAFPGPCIEIKSLNLHKFTYLQSELVTMKS